MVETGGGMLSTENFTSVKTHHRSNNGAQREEDGVAGGGGAGNSWATSAPIKL